MMPDLRDTTAHLMPVREPQSSKTLETAKTPSPTVHESHKDLKDPKVPPNRPTRPHQAYLLLPEPVETTGSSITTPTALIVRRTHHPEAPPSRTCGRVFKTLLPHSCQSQHLTLLSDN